MSLLKIPLLLASAISYDIAVGYTSLNPTDSKDNILVKSVREQTWRHVALPASLILKATAYLIALAECIVILIARYDRQRPSETVTALLNALGPAEASQLTPSFILGASLVIASGVVRLQCYRTLGPYFTFAQCIRKDHRLVTTGVYAVVRHPGYSSLLVCFVGFAIMHGSPGSWLRASGMVGVPWIRAVSVVWGSITTASILTLFTRPTDEDRFLSERFGTEWEDWAKQVKYKLIPFIF